MTIGLFFWIIFILAVALDIYRFRGEFLTERLGLYILIGMLGYRVV